MTNPADFFAAVAEASDPRRTAETLRAEARRLRRVADRMEAFTAFRRAREMRAMADLYEQEADTCAT